LSMSRGNGVPQWREATDPPSPKGRQVADVALHPGRAVGGADRVRTGDLRLARAALSQLSYSPEVEQSGFP
jgi:hypothetical protein